MVALELGNDALHFLHRVHHIILIAVSDELVDALRHLVEVVFAHAGNLDLLVEGRLGNLFVVQHLLVELLTITQTRIFNLHVHGATQSDHALGQIGNLHRLTHIEDEDLSSLTHRTGLQHQLTGLGDEHEVAEDIRMRHGNRTTLSDLLTEQWNHRAIRAQHVSEAGGNKLRLTLDLSILDSLIETLHVDFADTLRATHYIGGVHRLIGRNHHELLHPIFHGQVGNDSCTVDIVLHGLARIILHHRHMLVGSGMEHIVRTEHLEHSLHP